MTLEYFFNLFLIISALHGFLFSCFIFFSRNGRKQSLVFVNLLILTISLNNTQFWVLAKNFFADASFINYALVPWQFLIAPFFYMFLIHYLEIEKKSKNILKLVLPFFLLLIAIRIGFVYFFSAHSNVDLVFLFKKYTAIEEVVNLVSSLSIFIYTYYILSKREKLFTRIIAYDNLKWIYNFFKLGALIYFFWVVALAITLALNFEEIIYFYYPLRVLTTVLIYWLGYEAVIQLRGLNEKKYLRKKLGLIEDDNLQKKSITSQKSSEELNISKKIFDGILEKLDDFEFQKEYTSNKITLNSLAKKINTNSNYLSKVINHYKKTSFTNYLNELRINNIIHQLKIDKTIRKFTIRAIAEEAGFNNSSSFSNAFVKIKGMKPSIFVKKLDKEDLKE